MAIHDGRRLIAVKQPFGEECSNRGRRLLWRRGLMIVGANSEGIGTSHHRRILLLGTLPLTPFSVMNVRYPRLLGDSFVVQYFLPILPKVSFMEGSTVGAQRSLVTYRSLQARTGS